ncbi:MAG: carbohydrate ABC transporter permease [Candidatus Bathyarchaeia archaeon]
MITSLSIIFVFPYIWMFLSALKTPGEIYSIPITLFPKNPQFENFIKIWYLMPMLRSLLNSLLVAVSQGLISVLTAALAGYALAKFSFPGRDTIFKFILCAMMLPDFIFIIPRFLLIYHLGWIDSYQALIFPLSVSAYGIFLFRQFTLTLPDDLIEAARVDGCSELKIFFIIILPMLKPIALVLFVFKFLSAWNELIWPLVATHSPDVWTLQIALYRLIDAMYGNIAYIPMLLAAATVSSIPTIILYVIMQKYLIKSIKISGLKGA